MAGAVSRAISSARILANTQHDSIKIVRTESNKEIVHATRWGSLEDISIDEKMSICKELVETARSHGNRILTANGLYQDTYGERSIATSEGSIIQLEDTRIYCSIRAMARKNNKTVSATESFGSTGGADAFTKADAEKLAQTAATRALKSSGGKVLHTRTIPVIMDPRVTGVFIHEAVGHLVEGDVVVSRESILHNKINTRIASSLLTVYDDPTMIGGWGSSKYDDEATRTTERVLVKNGRLKEFIVDKSAAATLRIRANGGARVESYSFAPSPRMSNTYIDSGDMSFEELAEDIHEGVLVVGTRGGQVDSSTGSFQFNAEEAQLILNGRLTTVLFGVSFSGNTLTTLKNIDGIGKDLSHFPNSCIKGGQMVATGTGGPYVRVSHLTIGGET